MKTLMLVLWMLAYCGGALAQQQPVNWLNRIKSGQPFKIILDVAARKFQDTDRMGATNPMGTIKAGETYTAVFSEANGWAVTGHNKGTGASGTWTYQQGRPEEHDLDVWGHIFKFSDNGEVFDLQHGLVGRLADGATGGRPINAETEARPQPPATMQQGIKDSGGQDRITWATTANALRGRNGQRASFACPPGGTPSAAVWGSDNYSDDSSICAAAVHAGLISAGNGGAVTIEVRPGAGSYKGSSRNGVSSRDYGSWPGSFAFAGAPVSQPQSQQQQPQPQPQVRADVVPGTNWVSSASALRGKNGQRFAYSCPGGAGSPGTVWGSDVYTDDSSVCGAAVHAGLITLAGGGVVSFEIRPGASAYKGSSRNGVNSRDYGSWQGSFVFAGSR